MELELLRANLVRTLVPVLVGALVTAVPLLADDQRKAAIYPLVAAAVTWFYYAAVRIAETRYPQLGKLLGRTMVKPGEAPKVERHALATGGDRLTLTGPSPDAVGVLLGGVPVHGVESVELTAGEGRATMLTLRIRDPRLELVPEGSTS